MSTLPSTADLADRAAAILAACGAVAPAGDLAARTPITGGSLGPAGRGGDVDRAVDVASDAFTTWRTTPPPVRGNLVRRLGELLREHKDDLGALVSIKPARSAPRASARSRR
jgi:aldehyde dehydrogenase (NAD+)